MKEEIEKLKLLFNRVERSETAFDIGTKEYRNILKSIPNTDNWLNDIPNLANRRDLMVEIAGVISYLERMVN